MSWQCQINSFIQHRSTKLKQGHKALDGVMNWMCFVSKGAPGLVGKGQKLHILNLREHCSVSLCMRSARGVKRREGDVSVNSNQFSTAHQNRSHHLDHPDQHFVHDSDLY